MCVIPIDSRFNTINASKRSMLFPSTCMYGFELDKTFALTRTLPSRFRHDIVERGSSVVECRNRNQVSPSSNPPLRPFRRLGIFVLSIDAPVDSAV